MKCTCVKMLLLWVFFAGILQTLASNSVPKTPNNPKNCKEIRDQGINVTGIYSIEPDASEESFFVYCDMETRGGGWLYILNRIDGSENFSVPWSDYKDGFGNLAGEFWLGLEHLYQLTGKEVNELLVELVDWDLEKYHIHYKTFSIASEEQNYRLQILGGYSGDLGDSLTPHAGMKFSTKDRDNDYRSYESCAKTFEGGWWYRNCHKAHLTGKYYSTETDDARGITWHGYSQVTHNPINYSFKEARMMIKPQSKPPPKI